MKIEQKEAFAQQIIDLVKSFDSELNNKELRNILSFSYKKFNESIDKTANKKAKKK
ncbi:MAG: hypothetical protein AABY22_31550 [Nanoarchaeota archaeon]